MAPQIASAPNPETRIFLEAVRDIGCRICDAFDALKAADIDKGAALTLAIKSAGGAAFIMTQSHYAPDRPMTLPEIASGVLVPILTDGAMMVANANSAAMLLEMGNARKN